jgi:hypothetical protein
LKPVDLDSLPSGLLERIAHDAELHFRLPATPQPRAAWMIRNPYSNVLCIELAQDRWSRRFFAKVSHLPLTPTSDFPALIQKEYELLRMLRAEPDRSGVARERIADTVEALAFYPDLPAVVTVEAVGRTLRKEYALHARRGGRRGARALLVRRAELCGNWLASFHARTATGPGSFDVEEMLAYCRVRLERLHARHPGTLTPAEDQAIGRVARQIAQDIAPGSLRISARHNDFASHNIIACREGGIRVLDFMACDQGANAFDVCNFWFDLDLLKHDPTYSPRVLADMQRAFMTAYGAMRPDQPDFRLAQLRYTLNRLLNELGNKSRWRLVSPRWHLAVTRLRRWLRAFGQPTH